MLTNADTFHDRCLLHLKNKDVVEKITEIIFQLQGVIYDGDLTPMNNLDSTPLAFIKFPDGTRASAGNYGDGWFAVRELDKETEH